MRNNENLLIRGGKIYTLNEKMPMAKNVYVENGIIKGVNVNNEEELISKGAREFNLQGDCLLPGLHDSHMHMLQYGINQIDGVDLSEANSIEEINQILKAFIKERDKKPGSWVVGYGWNHERFADKKMPTAEDLDKVSREHYIAIMRICVHIATVNSRLLELCDITEKTYTDTKNIGRDESGKPNGLIYEDAISSIALAKQPTYRLSEIEDILLESAKRLRASGFTAVQTDDIQTLPDEESKVNIMRAYDNLRNAGLLPLRIMEQMQATGFQELKDLLQIADSIENDDMFSVQLIKLILDGSLGGWTAAMTQPYADNSSTTGMLNFTTEELIAMTELCGDRGLQVAFHAIGDRTIDQILDVIEAVRSKGKEVLRPRIVHCQLPRPDQLQRMKSLGVMADIQPMFVPSDYQLAEQRLTPKQQEVIYGWKSLMDCGIPLSGSSDAPVETYEPFFGIRAAVERTDISGNPVGGWKPKEKLTVNEAVALYTKGSAYSAGKEQQMGIIAEGYFADFTIVDKDPYEIQTSRLHTIRVKQTICAGR